MKKIKNNKGFTLAELLIVVAIIAALVAIMIPTFSGQIEKAREAADLANLRAAYSEASICFLNGADNGNAKIPDKTKMDVVTVDGVVLTQTQEGWKDADFASKLPFDPQTDNLKDKVVAGTYSLEFTFGATGKPTVKATKTST